MGFHYSPLLDFLSCKKKPKKLSTLMEITVRWDNGILVIWRLIGSLGLQQHFLLPVFYFLVGDLIARYSMTSFLESCRGSNGRSVPP